MHFSRAAGRTRQQRHRQRGSVLTYFLFLVAAVAVAGAVALTNITALSKMGSDSRGTLLTQRALNVIADSAVALGYAEGTDGRPALPAGLVYVTGTGAPTGGTLLPVGIAPTRSTDAWGRSFGFCNFTGATWSGWNTPMYAILSSGRDRTWQTSCSDVLSGVRRGDDVVTVVSAADWRAQGGVGKTDAYQPPLALLSQLNTVVPKAPGELRLVLETKELYINATGVAGATNWQLVSGASSTGAKYIALDSQNMRKWSDGSIATSCAGYLQGGAGYAYTGAIGDGVYWVNPAGTPYGMYCDMTTEMGARSFYTGLVAYWPMDETSGTTAYDMTGNHNAVLNSVPAAAPADGARPAVWTIGKSISGANPIAVPEILANNPNQVTISAWVDIASVPESAMLFGWNTWDVWRGAVDTTSLGFNTGQSDVVGVQGLSGYHHFVFVFDRRPSTTTNFALDERIYVDGIRQPLSQNQGSTPAAANRVWQSNLYIGGWASGTQAQFSLTNSFFQDVAVWQRALTDNEVSLLYTTNRRFSGMLTAQAGLIRDLDASGNARWRNSAGTGLASCNAYYQAGARANDVYLINPTGSAAFEAYCDMTSDGGGWTLVMKQASNDGTTLQGDTTYWTNGTTLSDTYTNLNYNDANLVSQSFGTLQATQYRLQAGNETARQFYSRSVSTPLAAFSNSTRATYSDDAGVPGTAVNWFLRTSTYPNGNTITAARFGFNFGEIWPADPTNIRCGARWGWAANQDAAGAAPGSHDSCGGLGAYGVAYGSGWMNNNKNAWQPAALYLWAR
ncbi:fibrinogen-like YCDxxxxGGGW domain-containing protein [Paraburkholderia sp. EG287A]|uniref:fibrinogen-like YCDxxxxGGGW domain-containing protein n=1 Tax=Paraburkholderia sp. EG287A TaxID=3237012 RepID=UPI0034D3833D